MSTSNDCWRRLAAWCQSVPRSRGLLSVLSACLLLFVLYRGVGGRHQLHGDGVEYVIQTQSIVFHGMLRVEPERVRDYWNRTNPFGVTLSDARPPADRLAEKFQAGGGFGGLYPDRTGNYRYYHYWLYSATVAPLYGALHMLDPSGVWEYSAFRWFNVLMLAVLLLTAWRGHGSLALLVVLALSLYSPLLAYCDWQHPEIYCLSLTACAFLLLDHPHLRFISPLLLGMAAAQNVPILLFFPLHLLGWIFCNRPSARPAWLAFIGTYAIGASVAFSSLAYFFFWFHTPSVINHIGLAKFEYASLERVRHVFLSPISGAVWLYPACFAFAAAGITRKRLVPLAATLVCVFAATWLCTATCNLNAGQVGPTRYATWLLAPLWCIAFRWSPTASNGRARLAAFIPALMATLALIFHFRLGQLVHKDIRRFGGCRRDVPEVRAFMRLVPYNDDTETLVENILVEELGSAQSFKGIYLWDLDCAKQLWVFSERGVKQLKYLTLLTDSAQSLVHADLSPRQESVLTMTDDGWTWRLPADPNYYTHPCLGRYILARTSGPVKGIRSNVHIAIRSPSIQLVP